jgi:hypothetical protein
LVTNRAQLKVSMPETPCPQPMPAAAPAGSTTIQLSSTKRRRRGRTRYRDFSVSSAVHKFLTVSAKERNKENDHHRQKNLSSTAAAVCSACPMDVTRERGREGERKSARARATERETLLGTFYNEGCRQRVVRGYKTTERFYASNERPCFSAPTAAAAGACSCAGNR